MSLRAASSSDAVFRERLLGLIYEENSDAARFVLATLAEDAMTKETEQDLWKREQSHDLWTIEHVLPQGERLPRVGSRCSALRRRQLQSKANRRIA